jgi:hypothetical protein
MKKIYKYMAGAAALLTLAACSSLNETPKFKDADSFVAFDKTSISVDENAGTVSLPITIASIDPEKVSVTYDATDGTAKKGTNYTLADQNAVLAFDGTSRTGKIVINITDLAGTYTGDLSFTVKLTGAGKLKLGDSNTCTVTIADLDHPLAAILGSYTAKGEDYGAGAFTYTLHLTKDPKDVKVVWCDYICPLAANSTSRPLSVYGNVNDSKDVITFPCGQTLNSSYNGHNFIFGQFYYDGGYYTVSEGNITFTKTAEGVWECSDGIGLFTEEYVFNGGMVMGSKNGKKTTWTKQ